MTPTVSAFVFDEWRSLAEHDLAEFELRRRTALDAFLSTSNPRQRALGVALQKEIDWQRSSCQAGDEVMMLLAKMLENQLDFLSEEVHWFNEEVIRLNCQLSVRQVPSGTTGSLALRP